MKTHQSYQSRNREPLYAEFERQLTKELKNILIKNYIDKQTTTRFDYDFIINLSKEIIKKNEFDLKVECLFPAWLRHFANRLINQRIKRFIKPQKTFIAK